MTGLPLVPHGMQGLKTAQLLDQSHGHVIPRPDGVRAPCGGLSGCWTCHMEHLVYESRNNLFVHEAMVIKPGDKVLLIAPDTGVDPDALRDQVDMLKRRFPDTEFTIVVGYTGVQISGTG